MNGTRFEQKSFSVPAVDKAPEGCKHGWLDRRGKCVLCGADCRHSVRTNTGGENGDSHTIAPLIVSGISLLW